MSEAELEAKPTVHLPTPPEAATEIGAAAVISGREPEIPNSERFSDYPTRHTSLQGEDSHGRTVIARLGLVKVGGHTCSCCGQDIIIGSENILTKVVDPDENHGFWRYLISHFPTRLDTWTQVRTIDSKHTSNEGLEKMAKDIREKAEKKQKAEQQNAGRIALRTRPGFITRRPTDL